MKKILLIKILRLILFGIFAFIIIKASTFGWRFWSTASNNISKNNIQLVINLKEHVYKLSQEIGDRSVFRYKALDETAEYIAEKFTSFGYNVEFQEYKVYNELARNIITTKIGTQKEKEIIVVGAHYDTCSNPGADDNASSIAGLLELARFMSDKQTNRTIKFVAFVNEEPPFFQTENMGSRIFVKDALSKRQDIKAAIILEMIGYYSDEPNSQRYPPFFGIFYPNRGNFITIVGNFASAKLVKNVTSTFREKSKFPVESVVTFTFVPGIDFSDHWSFWQEGIPAVMITDTAFLRNYNYHTEADTYEKLNYNYMGEFLEEFTKALIELDNKIGN